MFMPRGLYSLPFILLLLGVFSLCVIKQTSSALSLELWLKTLYSMAYPHHSV